MNFGPLVYLILEWYSRTIPMQLAGAMGDCNPVGGDADALKNTDAGMMDGQYRQEARRRDTIKKQANLSWSVPLFEFSA